MSNPDHNVEFTFGENSNYHQIGNAYLRYEVTVEKDALNQADRILFDGDTIRLINNAFAFCFKARSARTGGSDFEHIRCVEQVSTIMRAFTSNDGDLICHFDIIDESAAQSINISIKHLVNNHDIAANTGKMRDQILLKCVVGCCETFEKISKQLGFHLTLKTADLEDIIYTTLADNITVKVDKFFIYVPILIPDAQTQMMFNESIQKSFTFSFVS